MKLRQILSFAATLTGLKPLDVSTSDSKHPIAKTFQDTMGIPMIVIGEGGLRPSVKPVFSVTADQLKSPLPETGLNCEVGFDRRSATLTEEGLKYNDVNRTHGFIAKWHPL